MIFSQVRNWVTWGKKLGHQAKSKENLDNTPEVTIFEVIIMNIAQSICVDDFKVRFGNVSLGVKN